MKMLTPLILSLCLIGCAGKTAHGDLPGSELHGIVTEARKTLEPRTLPNGRTYCLELATTKARRDQCARDLEDGLFDSEQDKVRSLEKLREYDRLYLQCRDPQARRSHRCKER